MKHRHSTRGAAPASDAAGHSDAPGTPLPMRLATSHHVVPRGFHMFLADSRRHKPTRLWLGPIRAKSGRLGPYQPKQTIQVEIQKKKVQNAPFDLYLNPISAHFTQTPKYKLSTSPHISSLTRLCALCLCV